MVTRNYGFHKLKCTVEYYVLQRRIDFFYLNFSCIIFLISIYIMSSLKNVIHLGFYNFF